MKKYKALLSRFVPIVLAVILTIILSEGFYQSMIRETTQNCWKELSMARDEAGREIGILMNNNMKMLDLASDAIVLKADFQSEESVLRYLSAVEQETIFDRVDVIYPDGRILIQNGEEVQDNGDKTYRELLEKGTHLSQRVPDHYTGREAIHAFSPIYNADGENIAILGATVYCSALADAFVSAHYGEDAQLFLVDRRDGSIVLDKGSDTPGSIYDMMDDQQAAGGEDVIQAILSGQSGQMDDTSQHYGKTSYTVYAPVENTEFTLIMAVGEEVVLADVTRAKSVLMKVGVVEVVLLVFFAAWIYFVALRSSRVEDQFKQAELELLQQKEEMLQHQYDEAVQRQEFLDLLAINLPGGYHRCTTDHSFRLTFASNSFTQVTGYTLEQLEQELDGSYMGIVAPEDREYFMSLAPQLEKEGAIYCGYRIRRRDGELRWVKDSTQYVEQDGKAFYQCTLTDITEQIEEMEQARQLAEASSQAKSTFLFNISHDIRTPMNAIKGFARIIEERADDPKLVRETIGKINQAGDSLMMLMNDVLDISRIERGKEELNLQPVDLYQYGRNLYEMFAADMQTAGIQFIADGETLDDHVYCDELKLTRIMMNMLSNAKKFTPAGGTVRFGGTRLHRDEKSCTYRFYVRDTGIGMSPEFLERAFLQFERERTSTESGVTGSGLGLAIIKMLVELMGGTVEIHSELGKGTQIAATITLLLADEEQAHQAQGQTRNTMDMSGKRVLLVEDNDFNREIARYILESMQFVVEEAENGAVCIEKLLAAPAGSYDLVLMDLQMPVMDGYTATAEIRNLHDREKANIPIVAMTANAFEEDKKKCQEVGMNGHVGKPIEMDALMQALFQIFQ